MVRVKSMALVCTVASLLWFCTTTPPPKVLDVPPHPHPELAKLQSLQVVQKGKAKHFGDARLEMREGVWVLHLKGSQYEMGYQQGILLRDIIRSNVADRPQFFAPYLNDTRRVMKNMPPELIEELQGIAAGSSVDVNQLFVTDILQYRRDLMGCSNVIVFGQSTKDGRLLHIRTYDYPKEVKVFNNWVVAFYNPQKGIPFMGIIHPGSILLPTGSNARGVSVGHGIVHGTRGGMGIADFSLLKYIVQFAGDLNQATEYVMKAPPQEHEMYLLAVADGAGKQARIFEMIGPASRTVREPEKDYILCTNHLVKKVARSPDLDSRERYGYWQTRIEESYGKIDSSTCVDFVRGYCPYRDGRSGNRTHNIHNAIFDAEACKALVTAGPPYPACHNNFHVFDLKEELR